MQDHPQGERREAPPDTKRRCEHLSKWRVAIPLWTADAVHFLLVSGAAVLLIVSGGAAFPFSIGLVQLSPSLLLGGAGASCPSSSFLCGVAFPLLLLLFV